MALNTEQNLHVTQSDRGEPCGPVARAQRADPRGAITYLPGCAQLEADEGGPGKSAGQVNIASIRKDLFLPVRLRLPSKLTSN